MLNLILIALLRSDITDSVRDLTAVFVKINGVAKVVSCADYEILILTRINYPVEDIFNKITFY
jgi:hypothetical protein